MTEKINAIIMLEILGKPERHIKKVLSEIVESLGKEKDVRIISKKIAEPKQIENKEVFTSFAEVEIETSLDMLMLLIFGYMPSHIEILWPENLKIRNSDLSLFLNELAKKLHQYDEITRAMLIERRILAEQMQNKKESGKKIGKRK